MRILTFFVFSPNMKIYVKYGDLKPVDVLLSFQFQAYVFVDLIDQQRSGQHTYYQYYVYSIHNLLSNNRANACVCVSVAVRVRVLW